MKKARNGFIKNIRYFCLIGIIAMGFMTNVASNGGGGSAQPAQTDGGEASPGEGEQPGDTITIGVTLDSSNSTTETVTPEGGSVSTTGSEGTAYELIIPSNALLSQEDITLTPIAEADDFPLSGGLVAAVKMGPPMLQFLTPVDLIIELPPSVDTETLIGFVCEDSGEVFHLHPIEIDGTTVTLQISHFTIGGVGQGSSGDIETSEEASGLTPEQQALSEIAALKEDYYKLYPEQEDMDIDWFREVLRDILYQWFYDGGGIQDLITLAQGDPDTYLEEAISKLNTWYHYLVNDDLARALEPDELNFATPFDCGHPSGTLCEDLGDVADAAAAAIYTAFKKVVERANERCIDGGDNRDFEALRWIELADYLLIKGHAMYENCGVFDIDELLEIKTCGLWSLEVDPAEDRIDVDECLDLKAIAKDINGMELPISEDGNPLPYRKVYWANPHKDVVNLEYEGLDNGKAQATGLSIGIANPWAIISFPETGTVMYDGETKIHVPKGFRLEVESTSWSDFNYQDTEGIFATVSSEMYITAQIDLLWDEETGLYWGEAEEVILDDYSSSGTYRDEEPGFFLTVPDIEPGYWIAILELTFNEQQGEHLVSEVNLYFLPDCPCVDYSVACYTDDQLNQVALVIDYMTVAYLLAFDDDIVPMPYGEGANCFLFNEWNIQTGEIFATKTVTGSGGSHTVNASFTLRPRPQE